MGGRLLVLLRSSATNAQRGNVALPPASTVHHSTMVVYEIISRVSSGISLVSCLIICISFMLFPRLRKPMNRLIFFASLGNFVLYIFYFVGTTGIPKPHASMALCRLQGFSIQVYISSSSWVAGPAHKARFSTSAVLFTLAMAINVYLIFFRKWAPSELCRLEPLYLSINYGLPLLHSLIFLVLDVAPTQAGIYGPANLWCWVSQDKQWIRLTFGYGITWVCCAGILGIYMATGIKILRQSAELKQGSYGIDAPVTVVEVGNPFVPSNRVVCVTEVTVSSSVSEAAPRPLAPLPELLEVENQHGPRTQPSQANNSQESQSDSSGDIEEKDDEIGHIAENQENMWIRTPQGSEERRTRAGDAYPAWQDSAPFLPGSRNIVSSISGNVPNSQQISQKHDRSSPAKKNSLLWLLRQVHSGWGKNKAQKHSDPRASHARSAAMAYAKMSVLMFISLIAIWGPPSANRVYLAINDNRENSVLSCLQAAFNPLQGFFDCIFYIAMSWSQCKSIARSIRDGGLDGFNRRWYTGTGANYDESSSTTTLNSVESVENYEA